MPVPSIPATSDVQIIVESDRRSESDTHLKTTYKHEYSFVTQEGADLRVKQKFDTIDFCLEKKIKTTGVMVVGLGGNNGSTFVASHMLNREGKTFNTREGVQKANWFGSVAESATTYLGRDVKGDEVHVPLYTMVPLLRANDIVIGGWDLNSDNLYTACNKAAVLEYDIKTQLRYQLEKMVPNKGIYRESFIAENQKPRVNHCLTGSTREQVNQIRKDIADFKIQNSIECLIVLWSANTERYSDHIVGIHDTPDNLRKAIDNDEKELAPSILYAVAAIEEGCTFINGSPQNTFCTGLVKMASEKGVFVAGNDFKTGQTKVKSVLADFMVKAGLKVRSVVSYNHLGNNDGRNLSSAPQFRSKEISKSNVIDDVIASNKRMYPTDEDGPDHCVVIKYIPYVGDSKRAMDEYTCEGMLGSKNTIVLYNTCEDSMLAVPLMMDLVIFTEFCSRLSIGRDGKLEAPGTVLTLLSLFLKAPEAHEKGGQIINSFFPQRSSLTNFLRIVTGLNPEDHLRIDKIEK